MDAKTLERLAHRCQLEHEEYAESHGTYFDHGDLLLLARCAAAWAKVASAENPQLERWDWPQGTKWYFRANGIKTASGDDPISAVKAAPEVKP